MKIHGYLMIALAGLCPLCLSAQSAAPAKDPERQVHWALGAYFGTGWYRVDENRSVFIFRVPPRQTVRESELEEDGTRTLGIEIEYPLSFGLHQLKDIPDFIDLGNYATISFTPGVQVEIPVSQRWYLRPYAHLGAGYETTTSEWAGIWYGGLKSRYRLSEGPQRWSLLNAVYYAGYKPEFKSRGKFGSVMGGLEFQHPLGNLEFGGDRLWLDWHLTYNYLFDELTFHIDENHSVSIRDQWDLGLALSKGGRRIQIGPVSFEHIGLSWGVSSNGHYRAISLNLTSPFTAP